MNYKIIINDIRNNKIQSAATLFFFGISVFVFSLTILLFVSLLGSIDTLVDKAKTPDYLQMHAGIVDEEKIAGFARERSEVTDYQILKFLNLNNADLSLGKKSLSENTQDNGVVVQSEKFDFLIDMENKIASVNRGKVLVPICYKSMYDVHIGDEFKIKEKSLKVAGFIRDSQMNSMMASSKRFLVNKSDYDEILSLTSNDVTDETHNLSEEYLIEFRLDENADYSVFASAYTMAELPNNGPAVTKALIKLMDALSDGLLIMVILIVSIVVIIISLICVRFIMMTGLERVKKEAGLLKAIGIQSKEIKKIYASKFVFLSVVGMLISLIIAALVSMPLSKNITELYGPCENIGIVIIGTILSAILIEAICILVVNNQVKKLSKVSALRAMYDDSIFKKKRSGQYVMIALVTAAALFLMILPENLNATISAKDFVSYMGIGNGEIRLDIRQCENVKEKAESVLAILSSDKDVSNYVHLQTSSISILSDSANESADLKEVIKLTTEFGDHTVFPVNYSEGSAPVKNDEIALSSLCAEDLNASIGDVLRLSDGNSLRVCGIYSDITNGGKTSKACFNFDGEVQWSIFYLSLNGDIDRKAWCSQFEQVLKNEDVEGVTVTLIDEYLDGTYGPTLRAIEYAALFSKIISALVLFVVVLLFLTLLIEQDRMQISLKKAIGISNLTIKKEFMCSVTVFSIVGIILGCIAGCLLGQGIVGVILSGLGAMGFKFVIDGLTIFIGIPAIVIIVFLLAETIAMKRIERVNATECVFLRE